MVRGLGFEVLGFVFSTGKSVEPSSVMEMVLLAEMSGRLCPTAFTSNTERVHGLEPHTQHGNRSCLCVCTLMTVAGDGPSER